MVWLGDISVSVYLLHIPVYTAVCALAGLALRYGGVHPFATIQLRPDHVVDRIDLGPFWVNDLFALALLGLVAALASLALTRFETPARRAITSWGAGWLGAGNRQRAPARI